MWLPVQTWGIGYGMDNATEWQEVFKTALKTAVVLVILDLLRLSKNAGFVVRGARCACAADAAAARGCFS